MPHIPYLLLVAPVLAVALWLVARRKTPAWFVRGALGIVLLGGLLAPPLAKGAGYSMFGTMGLFAWTVFVLLPCYLALGAALLRRAHARWALAGAAGSLLIALIALDAFWYEPHALELNHVHITTPKLSEPVRIAVIADVQTDHVGDYERRAIELAMAQEPDLVLLAGDYVQALPEDREREQDALRRVFAEAGLAAPLGVYAVRGNCDPLGWERAFEGLPVRVFEDTARVELDELAITGLSFPDSFRSAPRIGDSERFEIVLGHAPDFALEPTGGDLLVAGHCHGGQVCLPLIGPLITLSRIPRAWASGTREIRPGTHLCVSRGVGLERYGAPPLRFLCRPEIVIIDLFPEILAADPGPHR